MASVKSPVRIDNFLQFSAKTLKGEKIDFKQYEGKVILVVNVASLWDTTKRDYPMMNELVDKFAGKLVVLGFPSNQFGHQVGNYLIHNYISWWESVINTT